MILLRAAFASLAFVSLGLPDGLLGVAWPSMRRTFGLEVDAVGSLLVATMLGYVTSSFSTGRVLRHMNVGTLVATSCMVTGVALLGYGAASAWIVFVLLGAALGLGAGAVDAALNTYAATRHSHGMLNWLHACYGLGAAGGPMLMTAVLARDLPWQRGYLMVAAGQLVLGIAFFATRGWWGAAAASGVHAPHAFILHTLRLPAAQLGILVFILYAGVEASIGLWTFTLMTEARGLSAETAAVMVSLFWGGLTAGRLLAAAAAGRVSATSLVTICLAAVLLGTLLIWWDDGPLLSGIGVALAGTACGPIFPTLIAITPARVGPSHAPNVVGFQVGAAAAGVALLPALVGTIAAATTVGVIAALFVLLAALLSGGVWALGRTRA